MITNLDRTLDEIFGTAFSFNLGNTNVEQIKTTNGDFQLHIDALGHTPSDIDIDVTSTKLTIKSEKLKDSSNLVRPINLKYTLGKNIDTENIEAEFKNGILIITVPIRGDTNDTIRKLKIKN